MTWPPPAPTSCTPSPPSVRRPGRAQVRRRGFLFLISRCMTQNIAFWRRGRGKWPTPGGSGLFRGAEPLAAGGGILKSGAAVAQRCAVRACKPTTGRSTHACASLTTHHQPHHTAQNTRTATATQPPCRRGRLRQALPALAHLLRCQRRPVPGVLRHQGPQLGALHHWGGRLPSRGRQELSL